MKKNKKKNQFDYCKVITSENGIVQAKILAPFDKNAAEIYSKLNAILEPIESLRLESATCPDYLVEKTIAYCNKHKLG